jgi:argininosuccinate lyase
VTERQTLWGGGFTSSPGDALWGYTVDAVDRRLLAHDIRGSQAHVTMLGEQGILSPADTERLQEGLAAIAAEAEAGEFRFLEGDEDVHSAVERRLVDIIGDDGGMLHTGRSRNDQVALDLRLYLVDAVAGRTTDIRRLVASLADQAEQHPETVVPSYTHLQQAQAVPLGHHLLAHAWMLRRDAERFAAAGTRIAVSPLGAGAAAGSSLPLDPVAVARQLGLPAVFANSIDAVGARDWAAEYVFACAQTMVHLSRLAEELVLWSTSEFGWVEFDEALTTGSSALPQKRNPDMAEVIRGRTATVIGDVTAILALQKALPLAYNRDLQEDKAIVFHADDTVAAALEAMVALIGGTRFEPPLPGSSVLALDLAEVLVARGVPFRQAHAVVARLVTRLAADGRQLGEVTAAELADADTAFVVGDLAVLDVTRSPGTRRTPGAASPKSVAVQVAALRTWIGEADGA